MFALKTWIRKLSAPRPTIRKAAPRTRPQFDHLEDRVVPAFAFSISSGTEANFADTTGNEQLWLRVNGGNLEYSTVNGATGTPGAFTSTGLTAASVTKITINSGSGVSVDSVYLNDTSLTTTAFTSLISGEIKVNGSSGTVAVGSGSGGNALGVNYTYTGANIYDVFGGAVISSSKLSVFYDGVQLGQVDDVVLGTSNHENGVGANPPVLNGTAQDDLIFGFGGNDIINGLGGNDIIVGGAGNDTLNGNAGDDTFVYRGAAEGYDTLDGGADTNRMLAVGAGTVISVTHLNGTLGPVLNETIQKIEGSNSGDTIVRSDSGVHSVLNFTNVELDNIAKIDAAGATANNIIYVSTVSDAVYWGNGGNDTFHLKGAKNVTLPYDQGLNPPSPPPYPDGVPASGFDFFVDDGFTGTATAVATGTGVVIGIGNNNANPYDSQLDEIQGDSGGDTFIQGSADHNVLNFANTKLTSIASVETGGGNDIVTTSLLNRTSALTYDGGTGSLDQLRLAVTLEEAIDNAAAIKADFYAAKANPAGPITLSNFFNFTIQNFESVRLAVYNEGELLGLIDNIIFGTANHDSGSPYAPVLNGTAQNDLMFGLGGNDIINGLGGNDIIVAGNANAPNDGQDTIDGGIGDDIFAYKGNTGYFDTLDGGTGTNRIIAVGTGTVVGVKHLNGTLSGWTPVLNPTIQKIEGPNGGNTIVRSSPSVHSVLNFTNVELDNIAEIDAAGGTANNTIYVSTVSDATYRGNGGNDTFYLQGSKTVTLPYSGANNGFDTYNDTLGYTGTATAVAEATGTVIGVANYNNQLDEFKGYSGGDTEIRASSSVHDTLNFATTLLTNIALVETGGGNDTVTTSLLNRGDAPTYDGGTYTLDQLRLAVTLEEAIDNAAAIKADFDAAKANPAGPITLSNFFNFTIQNFESVKLAVYNEGELLGLIDNIIFGTADHDSGSPYAPVLNGTAQNDLMFGLGGDDIVNGNNGNDILVGGNASTPNDGNDTLSGGAGDDIFAYKGNTGFYDTLDGGTGTNRIIAVGTGTVVGVTHLNNGSETIQKIEGPNGGNTIVRSSPSVHSVLNFTNVELDNIAEIDAAGGTADNTIYVSTLSDGVYRGNGGNDTFHLKGAKNVTLPYSGSSNGFDSYVDDGFTGTATAVAETAGTVIGVANYNNQLDEFQGYSSGGTEIRASSSVHDTLNFATTLLTDIVLVETGGGDDIVTTSLLNRTSALTYDGGNDNPTYPLDQLRLAVTAAEASANAAAIAADILAINAAITSNWFGGPLALSFFKFSVINFESVALVTI